MTACLNSWGLHCVLVCVCMCMFVLMGCIQYVFALRTNRSRFSHKEHISSHGWNYKEFPAD